MRTPARSQAAGRRRSAIVHHAIYAVMGLCVGLALVVPSVLWLTARPEPPRTQPVLIQEPRPARADAAAVVADVAEVARRRAAEQIERARRLIGKPDIAAARNVLADAVRAGEAEALFLLAETYDPNRLAALGVTDVRSEAERARHLYREALDKGHEPARARLDQLK